LAEPIYFDRERYDLSLPLIALDPNFAPSEGETTFIQTIVDPAPQQQRIFQALTQVLTPLGVRFEFSIQQLPQTVAFDADSAQTMFQSPDLSRDSLEYRLLVRCHSPKSLECQLLAEPLARVLRSIQLEHFTEAIVKFGRSIVGVASENEHRDVAKSSQVADWRLKIDLTPPAIRLRSWARWGDVQAITHLLNDALSPEGVQVSTTLKNLTLQVFCTLIDAESARFPAKKIVIDTIAPLLISLTPQGIQGATIHGLPSILDPYSQTEEPPVWIHWLDLPALGDPKFSPTPIVLAGRGDREALSFILERLLNPDLEQVFELGGINLSVLVHQRLLHVMSEAPNCPIQSQVATTVVKVIKQLRWPGIRGVRVHGRRAGQSISLWTAGVDFDTAQPLLAPPPSATPRSPQPAAVKTPSTKVDRQQQIAAALVATGIWKPQLNLVNSHQLAYQPRFQWQPSLLLLLVGLGLTIAGDFAIKVALASKQIAPESTATVTPQLSFNNPLLEQKLAQYQLRCLQHGVPDVLIVGSSRALRGVDPEMLRRGAIERGYRNPKLYNFGINGATAQVVDLILRQLLTSQQLPKLVIWADGARAFNSGRIDRTYEAIALSDRYRQLALMSGLNNTNSPLFQAQSSIRDLSHAVDTTIDSQLAKVSPAYYHRDRIKTWLQSQVPLGMSSLDRANSNLLDPSINSEILPSGKSPEIDFDGFLPLEVQFEPITYYQKYTKVTGDSDGDYANFQLLGSQDRALHQTIDLLASHQIPLIFVNMPLTDIYLDKYRSHNEASFKQYMQQLMDSHQLTFVDLDGVFNTRHDLFSDPSHLNQFGAIEVSKYLAKNPKIRW
jgi:hypothetical protein